MARVALPRGFSTSHYPRAPLATVENCPPEARAGRLRALFKGLWTVSEAAAAQEEKTVGLPSAMLSAECGAQHCNVLHWPPDCIWESL